MKCMTIVALLVLLATAPVNAQTVSILNTSPTNDATLVEISLKRLLRAEGYTVKGGTTDGYVVLLQAMPTFSKSGAKLGVIGAVTIGALDWLSIGDLIFSEQCKKQRSAVLSFN